MKHLDLFRRAFFRVRFCRDARPRTCSRCGSCIACNCGAIDLIASVAPTIAAHHGVTPRPGRRGEQCRDTAKHTQTLFERRT